MAPPPIVPGEVQRDVPLPGNLAPPPVSAAPFGDNRDTFANVDPYAPAPTAGWAQNPQFHGPPPESKVQLVATFLMVIAGLSIPMRGLVILGQLLERQFAPNEATVQIIAHVGFMLLDIVVIFGSYNILKLKNKAMAMTGAIIACVPCCGPCWFVSIPFGIWALVVINDPHVSRAFKS